MERMILCLIGLLLIKILINNDGKLLMKNTRNIQTLAFMTLASIFPVSSQTVEEWMPVIKKLNQEIGKALIDGNIEKSMSFYTKDAISMPNNGNIIEGVDDIKNSTLEMLKSGSKVHLYDTQTLHLILCNDLIIEIGKFKILFSMPGVQDVTQHSGKYLNIWEKISDRKLKIKLETWNSDIQKLADVSITGLF